MNPSQGLQTALNEIRNTLVQDNSLYQTQIPLVDDYTSSQVYGQSLLNLPSDLRNRFIQSLVNRIAYTRFMMDYFENPLRELAGDDLPLGAIGQEIYVNPARGRVYDINDFAGLLVKYESDIKAEYTEINFDVQYPVTIIRKELEKAFVSWGDFESFLMGISTSLYNGAYIDDYKYTKKLITNAYVNNAVQMETISFAGATPTKAELEVLTARLRQAYLDFMVPSTKYNAWKKVGGYGRSIVSWSKPENIVVFVSNKMASILDVNVLASAFNIDKADLMGRVYYVEDFDILDDSGEVVVDGSNIVALICDRRWFKIREKDMFMDEFYNANNRSWQSYLNVIKSFNYSLFANALMLVTALPTLNISSMAFASATASVEAGEDVTLTLNTTPFTATQEVIFTSSDTNEAVIEIEKVDDRHVKVTGVASGSATITATAGEVTATVTVTVTA
ncbi:MAG: Ig-like domain-containing protein [Mycoplasmataceae bacterium]|nr:Ig-like domain-containing protein [Bacilli bacterium]MBQ5500928.1 Ig-like domain-containing protein [Mycoplasmataceae bacterium]